MPKEYKELPISGTMKIQVPEKMLKFGKDDKMKLVNTLTKGGTIAGGSSKTIVLIPNPSIQAKILSQGSVRPATKQARENIGKLYENEVKKITKKTKDIGKIISRSISRSGRVTPMSSTSSIRSLSSISSMTGANPKLTYKLAYPDVESFHLKLQPKKRRATRDS